MHTPVMYAWQEYACCAVDWSLCCWLIPLQSKLNLKLTVWGLIQIPITSLLTELRCLGWLKEGCEMDRDWSYFSFTSHSWDTTRSNIVDPRCSPIVYPGMDHISEVRYVKYIVIILLGKRQQTNKTPHKNWLLTSGLEICHHKAE